MTEISYAAPFERLIARIIDKVVITLPVYLWLSGEQKTMEAIGGGILLVTIVLLNYFWDGQTVGKRVMNIRIQSSTGGRLNMLHYLWREFTFTLYPFYVYWLSNAVFRFGWLFWMLTTIVLVLMYGRGIHDFLSGTVVARTEAHAIHRKTQEKNQPVSTTVK